MPSRRTAGLFHGMYCLQVVDGLTNHYLCGGEDQTATVKGFDIELPDLFSARKNLAELTAGLVSESKLSSKKLA